ncbi:MAG: hypothetical protein HC938_11225 [Nitrospira sp.]|nr:hypothetical protein [Nitrospira sp.]
MPANEEQHIAIAEEKLRRFLALADDVLALRTQIQWQLDQQVRHLSHTLRNRVLVALYLKTLDSFDRLIVDAREKRSECSHHLKTMAESFIYSGWVGKDQGDTRAKLILADGYRSKVVYYGLVEEQELAAQWGSLQSQVLEGIRTEWKDFHRSSLEQIADEGNRSDHYRQVYRLACEAAHLGDLFMYMPPQPEGQGIGFSDQSMMRAYVCLKFGLILACDMLHDATDSLGIHFDAQLEDFRGRWRAVIDLHP